MKANLQAALSQKYAHGEEPDVNDGDLQNAAGRVARSSPAAQILGRGIVSTNR